VQDEAVILLVGSDHEGVSTLFKHFKLFEKYGGSFTVEQLAEYKQVIHSYCLSQMKGLLDATMTLNASVANPYNLPRCNYILELPETEQSWSEEVAEDIRSVWSDQGIKHVYSLLRQHGLFLDSNPHYFFDNIQRFMHPGYTPTVEDVLALPASSGTGVQEAVIRSGGATLRIVNVQGQRNEGRKWIHCFDSVTMILFCTSLTEYDICSNGDPDQNWMKDSIMLFDELCNAAWFKNTPFAIFMNNVDLFRIKIPQVSLTKCFPEYTGGPDFENAKTYIQQKYIEKDKRNRTIYTYLLSTSSTESVELSFKYFVESAVTEMIKRKGYF